MLDRILARTTPQGRCAIWTGPTKHGAPVSRVTGFRDLLAVRRMVLLQAGPLAPGVLAAATCGNPLCVSQRCVRGVSRKRLQQITAKHNDYHQSPSRSAKIAAKAKARRVLSDEQAMAAMSDPRPIRAVAAELGVGFSIVQQLRAGKTYRFSAGNPWAGLM